MIVMDEEKIYDGVFPLGKALKSVSIGHSSRRPVKYPRPTTIKKQEYDRVRNWMRKYSSRVVFDESGNATEIKGKPVFPSAEEMKRDLGITWYRFDIIARNNGDNGVVFHYRKDISEEQKRNLEEHGLRTGVDYVALESQYPPISKFFEEKKS